MAPVIANIPTDLSEIASIESDLWRRLDMVVGGDDLPVLLGMVAAGEADAGIIGELAGSTGTEQDVTAGLASASPPLDLSKCGLPTDKVARYQRLWYHFKVPFAEASLVWWYLFCLGLGRKGDVGQALVQMDQWLAAMSPKPTAILGSLADMLGLSRESAVITDDESRDVGALMNAVQRRAPLVWTEDIDATAAAHGCQTITPHATEGANGAAGRTWWLGAPADLRAIESKVRARWSDLPEAERDELLATLQQKVTSIERMRFRLDESVTENRATAGMLSECRDEPPDRWPYGHLVLATTLWCWYKGGFALQEFNQSFLSLATLTYFLVRRIREYARVCEKTANGVEDLDPVSLAEEFARWRTELEQTHVRCLHFDGSNWERREFLLPRSAMEHLHEIPERLREQLYQWTGVDFPDSVGTLDAWDQFLELALAAGSSPTRVMQAMTQYAANAGDFPIDMAVFTVPMGCKLTEPWTLVYSDIFCYTGFRDGFHPAEHGVPGDLVSIQNIQGQRQRFNAVKKAQNYAPVRRLPPQGFNLPDISIAEDAHHAGHFAAGVRLACRVPITIFYRDIKWNGISDVRLNRVEYRRDNRFLPRDLVIASRYAQWVKGVADAAYRRDLFFDGKWGSRVTDLEL